MRQTLVLIRSHAKFDLAIWFTLIGHCLPHKISPYIASCRQQTGVAFINHHPRYLPLANPHD